MREPHNLANCKLTENSLDWGKFYDELEFRVRSDWVAGAGQPCGSGLPVIRLRSAARIAAGHDHY